MNKRTLTKLFKVRRRYNIRKKKRRLRPGLHESNFNSTLRIYNYSLNISESSQFPLILRFGAMIFASSRALQLATLFQQYKLNWMKIKIIPIIQNGTSPTPLYILSGMDREISPTSNLVVEMGKSINNKNNTTLTVKSTGRQNDFNYWFDCAKIGVADYRPTVQVAFAVDELAGKQGKYDIQVLVNMTFRYPQNETPPFNSKGQDKIAGVSSGEKIDDYEFSKKEEEEEDQKDEDKIESIKAQIKELNDQLNKLTSL